ncbi:hypothetical protein [Bradyrhizobium sp. CCBAU 53415]|uniref:hypothetical protein n=1 Tax=Bradyrhizobium sp. CCBAU 53415 TaxID=1325119 RepID=UPI002306B3C6|nr:hypothetical protein [Bradyrhizobium sp. CCBAU 53415]
MDDVAGLIALSATALLRRNPTPHQAIRRPKPASEINERDGLFDPGSVAKGQQHTPIVSRPAAVRRHAVCGAVAHANIVNKISYMTESDAIVTWLDLIMGHQYGPRGF